MTCSIMTPREADTSEGKDELIEEPLSRTTLMTDRVDNLERISVEMRGLFAASQARETARLEELYAASLTREGLLQDEICSLRERVSTLENSREEATRIQQTARLSGKMEEIQVLIADLIKGGLACFKCGQEIAKVCKDCSNKSKSRLMAEGNKYLVPSDEVAEEVTKINGSEDKGCIIDISVHEEKAHGRFLDGRGDKEEASSEQKQKACGCGSLTNSPLDEKDLECRRKARKRNYKRSGSSYGGSPNLHHSGRKWDGSSGSSSPIPDYTDAGGRRRIGDREKIFLQALKEFLGHGRRRYPAEGNSYSGRDLVDGWDCPSRARGVATCNIYVGGGGQEEKENGLPVRYTYRKTEQGDAGNIYPGPGISGDWRFWPGTPPEERRCFQCSGIGHIRATCPYRPSSDGSPNGGNGVAAHAPILRRRRRRGRSPSWKGDREYSPRRSESCATTSANTLSPPST